MEFKKGYLYHVYNQENKRQEIFFNKENYLLFLKKIETYILPYADVLSWCLMPNHFHLLILVNEIELYSDLHVVTRNYSLNARSLNNSIAIMLRSYTRAINHQEKRSGSLFRESTKTECVNCFKGVKLSFSQSDISLYNLISEKQYPQICFNYIHDNPVKAGLVRDKIDWEFSSAMDYFSLRYGGLVNKKIAKEYVDF
ncbi:MAG: hypothetical protein L3J08_07805 [Flavobacteriaceae bacterium]|nr:hypothetical protein [Flavobacteriaceae bacterium]